MLPAVSLMDGAHAAKVLAGDLQTYHPKTYEGLRELVARPGGDIRVLGAIDDGGWSAFAPVSQDFVMTADNLTPDA